MRKFFTHCHRKVQCADKVKLKKCITFSLPGSQIGVEY